MQVWNVLHAARWKYRTQKVAKNGHLGIIASLSGYIFAMKARIDNRKKTAISATHVPKIWWTSAHYSGWDRSGSLGHPTILAALLHGTLVESVDQTLRRWTEGATYIRQGGQHVGHRPTFLVYYSAPQCLHCKRCTSYSNSICLFVCLSVCHTPVLCQNDCTQHGAVCTVR